ncbi:sorting nexin-25 [Ischnura elegans]|uniref:sorting nexin-25 n=1 Tax=Ischnura elegans TaxID=197161 RepID=UPI001ED8BC88|nr:sorting nexin-25 [Ischnura elegans]
MNIGIIIGGSFGLILLYHLNWVTIFIFSLVIVASMGLGISSVICAHIILSSKHNVEVSPPIELETLDKLLQKPEWVNKDVPAHLRFPVIYGRVVDGLLHQLVDLILRDFITPWLKDLTFNHEDHLLDIKDAIWKAIQNLQERLSRIDEAKLVAGDMIVKVTQHFEKIRVARAMVDGRDKTPVLALSPHLMSREREEQYLRRVSELAVTLLLPPPYSSCRPLCHLLREVLACAVLYPAIKHLCDPDNINQRIMAYVKKLEQDTELHNRFYTYAPSFDEFIQFIKKSNDIELLRHIRYSIVTEIMQRTTIQSLKKQKSNDKEQSQAMKKEEILQARKERRYMNQLAYAKNLCEKKLKLLGWLRYPQEEFDFDCDGVSGREILPIENVLSNVVGRKFFAQFLEGVGCPALVGYWGAVEELRQADRKQWHQLGAEIFYAYVHLPTGKVKVDKAVRKKMEAFLLGDGGHEVFFEVQEEVFRVLEKQYPNFAVSELYGNMLTAMDEAAKAEFLQSENSLEEAGDNSGCGGQTPLHVADHSNYARKKLDQLEERLNNKMQALQALRTSVKPESRVLGILEKEVEWLEGEKRQLEAHVSRTETWGEHLGRWRATVQSAEIPDEKEPPQFVLVVHILEDEQDSDAVSTGWVVLRKLPDFLELHRKLRQLGSEVKGLELPSQSGKFLFGKGIDKNSLEKAKSQIQKYLEFVLQDEKLNQSEALYAFLSPSSEHLKQAVPSPKKSRFSLSTLFKSGSSGSGGGGSAESSSGRDTCRESDEDEPLLLEESVERGGVEPGGGKDSIAEPLYALLGEVFDLRGVFRWLRRTLITFVQITYGHTINRQVRETVSWIFSEPMLHYYVQFLIKSWWPNGSLVEPSPQRTEKEKVRTRWVAKELFVDNIPEVLSNLVGQQSARRGAIKVFETLQDVRLNKQLFYDLFEVVIYEVFPEIKQA